MSFLDHIQTAAQLQHRECRIPFWISPIPLAPIRADLERRGFEFPADQETIAMTWEVDVCQPNATYLMLQKKYKRGGIDGSIAKMTMKAASAQLIGGSFDAESLAEIDVEPEHWNNEKKRVFAAEKHLVAAVRIVIRLGLKDEDSEQICDLNSEEIGALLAHPNIIPLGQKNLEGAAWEGRPIGLSILTLVESWAQQHKKFVASAAEEAADEMGKASDGGSATGSRSKSKRKKKSKRR